jgi:hypothetical protein
LSKAGPAAPVIQPLLIIIQACIPVNQILDAGQCPRRTPGHPDTRRTPCPAARFRKISHL